MLRSSASAVLSACVYMADLPEACWELIYHKKYVMQYISVTHLRPGEPMRQLLLSLGQHAVLVAGVAVKPLFRRRKQPAIDLAAEFPGRAARPVAWQQRARQQGIAQHHATVMVDQKDSRRESLRVGERGAASDPAVQRLEGLHEFLVGVGGAVKRPALAEQA